MKTAKKQILCINLILIVHFSIIYYPLSSQNLEVPFYAQRTDLWCWAACMQSIIEYKGGGNVEQCNLAVKYFQNLRDLNRITDQQLNDAIQCCPSNCSSNNDCHSFTTACSACIKDMILKTDNISFFERIFSAYSFNATEDNIFLEFDIFKTQIDGNMPLILAISMQDKESYGVHNSHALVAKGYKVTSTNKYMKCSNPWKYIVLNTNGTTTCKNYKKNVQINHKVFTQTTGVYKKVDGYVYNIKNSQQVSHMLVVNTKKVPDEQNNNIDKYGIFDNLNDEELEKLAKQKNIQIIKVRYISDNKLKAIGQKQTNLDTIGVYKDIVDVVDYSTKPAIVSTLQKIDNVWTPIEIYEDDVKESISVVLNKEKLILSNNKNQFQSEALTYEVVKIYPYPYEFYRFKKNDKFYFTPKETYQNLKLVSGKQVYQNYAYLDFRLLLALQNSIVIPELKNTDKK